MTERSTKETEERLGDKFCHELFTWTTESSVNCRQFYTAYGFDRKRDITATFGTGDKSRFIDCLKTEAVGMNQGQRVLIKWRLSTVEGCIDVSFKLEKDPTQPNGVVYE
jgi:hypothetical protein